MKTLPTILTGLFTLVASCASGPDASTGGDDKADHGHGLAFQFRREAPEEYRNQTDHLGLSLVTTVLRDRSDDTNCRGVENKLELLGIYKALVRLHRMWGDDIAAAGYPLCSMVHPDGDDIDSIDPDDDGSLLDYLTSVPCTLQKIYRITPDGSKVKPVRVLDVITPDYATIDVDEPAGFPNGRHPTDQITDLILAMGLADLSKGRVETLNLNPPENDVPFLTEFPYLAPAHKTLPGTDPEEY